MLKMIIICWLNWGQRCKYICVIFPKVYYCTTYSTDKLLDIPWCQLSFLLSRNQSPAGGNRLLSQISDVIGPFLATTSVGRHRNNTFTLHQCIPIYLLMQKCLQSSSNILHPPQIFEDQNFSRTTNCASCKIGNTWNCEGALRRGVVDAYKRRGDGRPRAFLHCMYRHTYKRRGVCPGAFLHCALLGYRHTYKRMCPGAFLHSVLLMYRDTSKRRGDVPGCWRNKEPHIRIHIFQGPEPRVPYSINDSLMRTVHCCFVQIVHCKL